MISLSEFIFPDFQVARHPEGQFMKLQKNSMVNHPESDLTQVVFSIKKKWCTYIADLGSNHTNEKTTKGFRVVMYRLIGIGNVIQITIT